MGEPLGGHKILTAAGGGVHVTPLCPSTVHGLAVALHGVRGVTEGQAGALAPAVGEGGGRLRLLHRQAGGAENKGGKNTNLGEHDVLCFDSLEEKMVM